MGSILGGTLAIWRRPMPSGRSPGLMSLRSFAKRLHHFSRRKLIE